MITMRAAQLLSYGSPDVIAVNVVQQPAPGRGEVLVRVRATSINGGELALRQGRLRLVSGSRFPKALGLDFSGEIAQVGDGVAGFTIGDRVWGVLAATRLIIRQGPLGSAAEFVVVEATRVSAMPSGVDFVEAVSMISGTTAITALRDVAPVRPGHRVLVRGGTGGVGAIAVQLAKSRGAHVTVLVSAATLDAARDLGADIALDYAITGAADLGAYDVILDTVGTQLAAYRRLLAPGGRFVAIAARPALRGLAAVIGSTVYGARRIRFFSDNPRHAMFADLAALVNAGAIRPVVDSVYPLDQIAAAHRATEAGGGVGKRVVQVA